MGVWTAETGCAGKAAYFTKREAKQHRDAVNTKNQRRGEVPTHVYQCPGCGYYHVGRGAVWSVNDD